MDTHSDFLTRHTSIKISPAQAQKFTHFQDILLDWNKRINLTRITDPDEIHVKHFLDSLMSFKILPLEGQYKLIDVGTGGGFPGIPLLIINPSIQLTLADSVRKKTDFCRAAVDALGYLAVKTVHARVEVLGQDSEFRERHDWAVARAVAPLNRLCEYLLPLVKVGGGMIALKGSSVSEEISQAAKAIQTLGGELTAIHAVELPGGMGERNIIHITKIKHTPRKYPRKAGIPKKSPLI